MQTETTAPQGNATAPQGNADVLPLIEQLGSKPMALASYLDNELKRNKAGLSVCFTFSGVVAEQPAREALKYCAAAFALVGMRTSEAQVAQAQPQQRHVDGASVTDVTLFIPAASILRTFVPEIRQYDQQQLIEMVPSSDSPGETWKALRVIRQAANMKRASQAVFG